MRLAQSQLNNPHLYWWIIEKNKTKQPTASKYEKKLESDLIRRYYAFWLFSHWNLFLGDQLTNYEFISRQWRNLGITFMLRTHFVQKKNELVFTKSNYSESIPYHAAGVMTFINSVNVKLSGKLQAACAFVTTMSLGVIIIVGAFYVGKGRDFMIF